MRRKVNKKKISINVIRANQNSSSPKTLTATKFNKVKIRIDENAGIHDGISGYQNWVYPAIIITSAIAVTIQLNQ